MAVAMLFIAAKPADIKAPDLTNTTWVITYQTPNEPVRNYDITFNSGGGMDNRHPNDVTPDNDRWEQHGKRIIMRINDAYVTYTGVIKGNTMKGTAKNQTGLTWKWTARKK